jgi:hypothetical protein
MYRKRLIKNIKQRVDFLCLSILSYFTFIINERQARSHQSSRWIFYEKSRFVRPLEVLVSILTRVKRHRSSSSITLCKLVLGTQIR